MSAATRTRRATRRPTRRPQAAAKPGTRAVANGNSTLELIHFVLPDAHADACPAWPPDVFAVVATVMRRTGCYIRCVPFKDSAGTKTKILPPDWRSLAKKVGKDWHREIDARLKTSGSISGALSAAQLPVEVKNAWRVLMNLAPQATVDGCVENAELVRALLMLSGFADEASSGIGLTHGLEKGKSDADKDFFAGAALYFLLRNGRQSFCQRVDPQRARVLGKKHTPQQGLTLRSLTHHLSLCMPWEVKPQWFLTTAPKLDHVLNLLLLPWPLIVNAHDFECEEEARAGGPKEHRIFRYSRKRVPRQEFRKKLTAILDRALERVTRLHAIVLPELALTEDEWQIAEQLAFERSLLLIAGILDGKDKGSGRPVNSCRMQFMSLPSVDAKGSPSSGQRGAALTQGKHHRWCLDRGQILQYGMGAQLPSPMRCWEDSHVGERSISFAHVSGWLTFSVLICEDLARQDPISDVLRSVGPNLVIALLMDGPQLAQRWSARYASVLADDPGTSVLTLTSLGMCVRSEAANGERGSRVIALWKDKLYGTREIRLEKDSEACVLSVARERREEFTADGRSDGGSTEIPVFSGVTPL